VGRSWLQGRGPLQGRVLLVDQSGINLRGTNVNQLSDGVPGLFWGLKSQNRNDGFSGLGEGDGLIEANELFLSGMEFNINGDTLTGNETMLSWRCMNGKERSGA
jgi:hypothetical protein